MAYYISAQSEIKQNPKFAVYKDAFMNTEQKDMSFFKFLVNLQRLFLITPISLKEKPSTIAKCFVMLIMFLFMSYTMFCIIQSRHFGFNATSTIYAINVLWYISDCCFFCTCLIKSNVIKTNQWRKLFVFINKVERNIEKYGATTVKTNRKHYFLVFLTILSCIGAHLFHTIFLILHDMKDRAEVFLSWCITHLYMILIVVLMFTLGSTLYYRYKFIEDKLTEIVKTKQCLETEVTTKINCLINLYKSLNKILILVNNIFSWHIFIYSATTIFFMLTVVTKIVIFSNGREIGLIIINILHLLIYGVSLYVDLLDFGLYSATYDVGSSPTRSVKSLYYTSFK